MKLLMLKIGKTLRLGTVLFAIFLYSNISYADEIIYPPEMIDCEREYCAGVDRNYFKISVPSTSGVFIFDYAYAVPAINSNTNYVVVYVYREQNSNRFGKALESRSKIGFYTLPYYPDSNWDISNSGDTLHCKGSSSQCGFTYTPENSNVS